MSKEREMEQMLKSESERLLNHSMDRRNFLSQTTKVAGIALGMTLASQFNGLKVDASPQLTGYPFTLGVASGDPLSDSVVLWTRLAPEPLADGGGMPHSNIPVEWEISEDKNFQYIVNQGSELARPELAHSVHVEVFGLQSNREYYYRFKVGNEVSPVGKTRTLSAPGENLAKLTFAFASCQQFEHGYYTAYKHMAEEKLDLAIHLGDYIYEYGPNEYVASTGNVRTHSGPEIISLDDYRNRYAQYKTDKHLQSAHAAFPWIVTWDDHEVENNYADEIPERGQSVEEFIKRRVNAYQAYYEHMPLRESSLPQGPDMNLYRRFTYGNLVEFNVLDTRQYRDNQANEDGIKPPNEESMDPNRTLLGDEQEQWLLDGLGRSTARWNVLAQQIFFNQLNYDTNGSVLYNMDGWDGYSASRDRILEYVKGNDVRNLVVLTGDVHANWAGDIKEDYDNPDSQILGSEFVGTSISSGGDGSEKREDTDAILEGNPHIKFFNDYRGYVRCTITPEKWTADYRVVPYVSQPGASIHTRATLEIKNNQPGLVLKKDKPLSNNKKSNEVEEDRIKAQDQAHDKQVNKRDRIKIGNE
ncbi:alkaline phosphatase D family protein [Oceanobacillus salinisoli]|uniref:alkaline phosphatase D family protein n=1 Tax=Oceanobacillus salinisoli TaxID=2678611 RepID=UPI0012E31CC1|nr:alkaline phosphatase [Oceanobacillus salinisoli]